MTRPRTRIVRLLLVAALALATAGIIRGPGKYNGVIVVDRWGGCALCSGSTVSYIAEKLKPQLSHLASQSVELDARKVDQPSNPGEARIDEAVHLGPAKPRRDRPVGEELNLSRRFEPPASEDLTLTSRLDLRDGEGPAVVMTLTNSGRHNRLVSSAEWNFVLFKKKRAEPQRTLDPADGPSFALITDQTFVLPPDDERLWRGSAIQNGVRYAWDIGEANALPVHFALGPGRAREVRVTFKLPPGEYDFVSTYTVALASNLVAFDVDAELRGKAATVPGRDPD